MHNNYWTRAGGSILVVTCLYIALVEGSYRATTFFRKNGDLKLPITCGARANDIFVNNLAVKYDATNVCQYLGWDWGHAYDGVSTYFEKKQVVEEYHDEPVYLAGLITLPIVFNDGAYINMYIEFSSITFTNGYIQLVDVIQDSFNVYDDQPEKIFIRMIMIPGSNILFKTWSGGWINRAALPFTFTTGVVYKVTFKAFGYDLQVLVNDEEYVRYTYNIHSSEAKVLYFVDVGMLLHKIEFFA